MPLTSIQALNIVKDRGLQVNQLSGQYVVKTSKGGRLHRGAKSTFEEAVEAADITLRESEIRAIEADGRRLFDILSAGVIYQKMRKSTIPDPDKPATIDVWDIFLTSNDSIIVRGERSLRAAVIEAEKVI